jgi:hypothetical protein
LLELSLHLLDLIENSTRAQASVVEIIVAQDRELDEFVLEIRDDGHGLSVEPSKALDPFYTTKRGKRTGLGLSLFRAAAEQAGGGLSIIPREGGGTIVRATMKLSHIDRAPLGDFAGTLAAVVCTHPEVDLRCCLRVDGRELLVVLSDVAGTMTAGGGDEVTRAYRYTEEIRAAAKQLGLRS